MDIDCKETSHFKKKIYIYLKRRERIWCMEAAKFSPSCWYDMLVSFLLKHEITSRLIR